MGAVEPLTAEGRARAPSRINNIVGNGCRLRDDDGAIIMRGFSAVVDSTRKICGEQNAPHVQLESIAGKGPPTTVASAERFCDSANAESRHGRDVENESDR